MFHHHLSSGLRRRLAYGEYVRNRTFVNHTPYNFFSIQGYTIKPKKKGCSVYTLAKKSQVLLNENIDCIICSETYKSSICRKLKCGHQFHLECIDTWLSNNETCPICRFRL